MSAAQEAPASTRGLSVNESQEQLDSLTAQVKADEGFIKLIGD